MATFRETSHGQTLCVYDISTPDIVVAQLERCIADHRNRRNRRVRIFYGDTDRPDFEKVHGRLPDPGHVWQDEYHVTGYIGKSTGIMPIPLMLANNRSSGGPGILDGCIVRMLVDGHEVYRHPNYHNDMDRAELKPSDMQPEYLTNVEIDGEVHARFKSHTSAARYLAFMRGQRMSK